MNDAILQLEELSLELIDFIKKNYKGALNSRYNIDEGLDNPAILEAIAKERAFLKKGAELDFDKAANTIIDEFRSGTIGAISLEYPN